MNSPFYVKLQSNKYFNMDREKYIKLAHKHIERIEDHWVWTGCTRKRTSESTPIPYMFDQENKKQISVRQLLSSIEATQSGKRYYYPTCGNALCVNPKHMATIDKLTDKQKVEVRERWGLYIQYKTSLRKLAKEYGVSFQAIEQIVKG